MSTPRRLAPRLGATRRPILMLLVGAGLLVAACGGNDLGASDPDGRDTVSPVAIAPATAVPAGLDDALALPADTDPVIFDYTEVLFETPSGETGRLGMLVADTIERRTRALMHRTGLPADTGMLFAFPVETRSPFWNQDTPMDIEIAVLDVAGVVQDILALHANDPTLLTPETPYLYAVQMPAGWWAAQGVGAGARFAIPEGVEGLAE